LLSGLFAISGVAALVARKFDAGLGGIILALLLGWNASDWLAAAKDGIAANRHRSKALEGNLDVKDEENLRSASWLSHFNGLG
jgi:hypothetical protein